MNIEKWPLNKIMQLPDWCFGRKYAVAVETYATDNAYAFDISEIALPETTVLWQLSIFPILCSTEVEYIRIGLGQFMPATEVQFMEFEPLINGLGAQGRGPREIHLFQYYAKQIIQLRQPIETKARKLCLVAYAGVDNHCWVRVVIVISSIPREVPDWMFSGQASVQM